MSWLAPLDDAMPVRGDRRWLVRRRYINTTGSVTVDGESLPFADFVSAFVAAGFEVPRRAAVSSHHVWDSARHKAPTEPRTA